MVDMSTIKVLLIEDNPGDARLVQEMLAEQRGAAVELDWKADLAQGLHRLAERPVDVVLLDLNLPDSKGFDTFARVIGKAPLMPIVVLTSLDDESLGIKAVSSGAQDYLIKGQVDGEKIVRALRYAIGRSSLAGERVKVSKEVKRLRSIASELDILEAAYTLERRAEQTAAEPLALPRLAELLESFEKGIRQHCVAEERRYLEIAGETGAQKMAAPLLIEHHELLRGLRELAQKAEEVTRDGRALSETTTSVKELVASLKGFLAQARAHADRENEFLFQLGHGA